MKVTGKTLFLLSIFSCLTLAELSAQSADITFNVNLQPQLKDSIFIPGRDWIVITGSQYPFTQGNNRLSDISTPKDSVYSVTLRFSRPDMNKTFNYNYIMYINGSPRRESMRRQIKIQPGEQALDPLYFDAFAW